MKDSISALRRGDTIEVEWLRHAGRTLNEVLQLLEEIHAKGASLVETATGRRSTKDAVAMIRDAAPYLRKGLPKKLAKLNGSKGGRPPKVRETAREEAEKIWFDTRIKSNRLALKKMKGYTMSAAYAAFGPSHRPIRGRPKGKSR